jgi:tRNA U38,U39,U40 pseudouridine synthase TruA
VLAAVGKGEMPGGRAAALLHERSPLPAQLTAPSSGLFLERVFYQGDDRRENIRTLGAWISR